MPGTLKRPLEAVGWPLAAINTTLLKIFFSFGRPKDNQGNAR
jgi:hypothetical protein